MSAIETYQMTFDITRKGWIAAYAAFQNATDDTREMLRMELDASFHWMQVARQNLNTAKVGV